MSGWSRVCGKGGSAVVTERLLQHILAMRRRSCFQALAEAGHIRIVHGADVRKKCEPAGEEKSDLFKHLSIAAPHGISGSLDWSQIWVGVDHELKQIQVSFLQKLDQLCFQAGHFPGAL